MTGKSRTRPWLKRTRSSLRGSTNSRRATASRDNTRSGLREGQTQSAGGVTTRPKHESICSRTVRSGKQQKALWSVVRLEKKPAGAKTGSSSRSSSPRDQGDPRLPGKNGSRTDSGPTGGGRGTRQRGLGVGEERTRGIPCTGGGGRYTKFVATTRQRPW